MSVDQDDSNSSDAGEHNGEVSEDQGVEEVEVDDSLSQRELSLPSAITFGGWECKNENLEAVTSYYFLSLDWLIGC